MKESQDGSSVNRVGGIVHGIRGMRIRSLVFGALWMVIPGWPRDMIYNRRSSFQPS